VTVAVLGGKGVLQVPDRRPPSVRARQLAAELRRLRDAARLTGEEVAGQLGWSPSKVSRIETGQTSPGAADLRRMLDIYEVTGTQRDRLERLAQSSDQRGWWDAYTDTLAPEYTALIALEAESESVRWYAPMMVPGLLQTERYAREVIRSGLLIAPPGEVERRVQVKMTRQRVLTRDDPLQMAVVIDEASILRTIGGPQVMREQLDRVLLAAVMSHVEVGVVPVSVMVPTPTGFTMMDDQTVLVSLATREVLVHEPDEVARYLDIFERLRARAVRGEALAELVRDVRRELANRPSSPPE